MRDQGEGHSTEPRYSAGTHVGRSTRRSDATAKRVILHSRSSASANVLGPTPSAAGTRRGSTRSAPIVMPTVMMRIAATPTSKIIDTLGVDRRSRIQRDSGGRG